MEGKIEPITVWLRGKYVNPYTRTTTLTWQLITMVLYDKPAETRVSNGATLQDLSLFLQNMI